MRGAIVLLRQLFLPPCHFAGQTNDHVVFIDLSVNRDGAECSAFDFHGLPSSRSRHEAPTPRQQTSLASMSGPPCFASLADSHTSPVIFRMNPDVWRDFALRRQLDH